VQVCAGLDELARRRAPGSLILEARAVDDRLTTPIGDGIGEAALKASTSDADA
jgi:hypothetical protein